MDNSRRGHNSSSLADPKDFNRDACDFPVGLKRGRSLKFMVVQAKGQSLSPKRVTTYPLQVENVRFCHTD